MPPPASHWQPTEFLAVLTSPGTRVCSAIVWSLMPPHSGKNGPWVTPCAVGGLDGAPGEVGSEPEQRREHRNHGRGRHGQQLRVAG